MRGTGMKEQLVAKLQIPSWSSSRARTGQAPTSSKCGRPLGPCEGREGLGKSFRPEATAFLF